ncbi:MAG: hypothetical protein ACREIC_19995 [Limisphaerales bacterium]
MRKALVILTCCTAVLLTGYVGYRGYKVWKQQHLMAMTKAFLAKSDERNAVLCLEQVLGSNPHNVEAARTMGNLAAAAHSPSALLWRSRVVELNPRSLNDRLALAQTAMGFNDVGAATNALEGVDEASRKTAQYQNVAGAVDVAAGRFPEAEAHFSEAARLEPTNTVPQLNLAVLRLRGTNALDVAESRIVLQRIIGSQADGNLRCQAARELIADAMRNKRMDKAVKLANELVQDTNSAFSDRLLRLDALRAAKDPGFNSALATLKTTVTNGLPRIYELAAWQMARTSPTEALAWLRALPADVRTNQTVCMLAADCQSQSRDWRGLQSSLAKQNWAELDFTRHALLARALRGQDLDAASKTEWELAIKATNNRKVALTVLLRTATQWGWQGEAEELLWSIVNQYPNETWAFRALAQTLFFNGRSRPLMMLYGQKLKRSPDNLEVKNNVAVLALLLDAQELKPHELAREVYESSPTNSAYASTYAFSLHLQKKDGDALTIMQKLSPQQLESPSIAGYYGLILKAAGDASKAKPYLAWASKAKLLPEEQKLFDRAKAGT